MFLANAKYIEKHRADWPFEIQRGPKWRPKSAKWRQKASMFIFTVVPLCASVTDLFPESIPIDFWWICGRFVIDLGSIFRNLDRIVNGFVDVLGHLLWTDVCKCVFLNLQINKQGSDEICHDLPRSNKIKQDPPKDRQAQTCKRHLPKRSTKTPSPKMRGRRCHAAWRLQ